MDKNTTKIPISFTFLVELPTGTESIQTYAYSYGEAYDKIEKKVGSNIYGKCRLVKKVYGNEEIYGW